MRRRAGAQRRRRGRRAPRDLPAGELQTWSGAETLRDQDFADITADRARPGARPRCRRWPGHPGERRTRRWTPGPGPLIDLRRAWRDSLRSGELLRLPTRDPDDPAAAAGAARRRQRLDGALLADAAALRLRAAAGPRRRRGVPVLDPTDAGHPRAGPRLDRRGGRRRCRAGCPTGRAARGSARRCGRSTCAGRARCWPGARSCWWCRTGGIAAIPGCCEQQVARLQRSCHRLIWLSPLLGTADYRPLTRGLVAALPFVDDFLPARTLRNLEDLARHLDQVPDQRPPRRQQAAAADNRVMRLEGTYTIAAPRAQGLGAADGPEGDRVVRAGLRGVRAARRRQSTPCGSPPASPRSAARSTARWN